MEVYNWWARIDAPIVITGDRCSWPWKITECLWWFHLFWGWKGMKGSTEMAMSFLNYHYGSTQENGVMDWEIWVSVGSDGMAEIISLHFILYTYVFSSWPWWGQASEVPKLYKYLPYVCSAIAPFVIHPPTVMGTKVLIGRDVGSLVIYSLCN